MIIQVNTNLADYDIQKSKDNNNNKKRQMIIKMIQFGSC